MAYNGYLSCCSTVMESLHTVYLASLILRMERVPEAEEADEKCHSRKEKKRKKLPGNVLYCQGRWQESSIIGEYLGEIVL